LVLWRISDACTPHWPWKKALYAKLDEYCWSWDHFQMNRSGTSATKWTFWRRHHRRMYWSSAAMSSAPMISRIHWSPSKASLTSLVFLARVLTDLQRLGGKSLKCYACWKISKLSSKCKGVRLWFYQKMHFSVKNLPKIHISLLWGPYTSSNRR
jgi:hypothetical protein